MMYFDSYKYKLCSFHATHAISSILVLNCSLKLNTKLVMAEYWIQWFRLIIDQLDCLMMLGEGELQKEWQHEEFEKGHDWCREAIKD